MTLTYDGLHHMHLGFDEPGEYGSVDHLEYKFDNKDTDDLAMFLYPRACALVAARKLAVERMMFLEYTDAKIKQDELYIKTVREIENGNTGDRTTDYEGRPTEGGRPSLCRD